MSSVSNETEEPTSTTTEDIVATNNEAENSTTEEVRPPAKRRLSNTVIEISDTDTDDSDVCAVNSYQASADEVKRIRGDYSSSSSSSDYSSESEFEDDSIVLEDKSITKPKQSERNPRANRTDDPIFNTQITSQEIIDDLSTHWKESKDHTNSDITLTCHPFRLCLIRNFLANSDIINNIVDDINTLDWTRKKMDLYEFHQTTDLASLSWQRSIRGIYELLKTDVMSWVSKVTGLELNSVSASCSLYGPGDHLLVHDDLLGDRRVAFIFYLAPWSPPRKVVENGGGDHEVEVLDDDSGGWKEDMGGALELFATDDEGRPTEVVHRIYPKNNMLAFFKVGVDSYHQVSEVLSLELPRLSINGWFHGPEPGDSVEPALPEPSPPHLPPAPPHTEVVLLNQWVEPTYMSTRSRSQIQAQMERESEVCLHNLLNKDKYQLLLDTLRNPDTPWELCGPSNLRRYWRIPPPWLEEQPREQPARELTQLISSTVFFRMLADCTDLSLATYERVEVQKWTAGCFTLLPPREHYQQARLEAVLYIGAPERGCAPTHYVAPEETAAPALVSLPPANNALNLVYCDAGAASFTKHLPKMAARDQPPFYIITCMYKE